MAQYTDSIQEFRSRIEHEIEKLCHDAFCESHRYGGRRYSLKYHIIKKRFRIDCEGRRDWKVEVKDGWMGVFSMHSWSVPVHCDREKAMKRYVREAWKMYNHSYREIVEDHIGWQL